MSIGFSIFFDKTFSALEKIVVEARTLFRHVHDLRFIGKVTYSKMGTHVLVHNELSNSNIIGSLTFSSESIGKNPATPPLYIQS